MKNSFFLLKNNFNFKSKFFRYAIRLTLSCSFIVILYETIHIKNGYWAAFSVIACVFPTLGSSLRRIKQRISGTFIGIMFGIILALIFGNNILLIDILLPLFIFLTFYLKIYTYSLYVIFITILAILFICLIEPGNWQIAITRLEMTLLGSAVAVAATFLIFPSRASSVFSEQLKQIKKDFQYYYLTICDAYLKNNEKKSQQLQLNLFRNLQEITLLSEDRVFERWKSAQRYLMHSLLNKRLTVIYQNLLILELNNPQKISCNALTMVSEILLRVMQEISSLFTHFEIEKFNYSLRQAVNLLAEVKKQRAVAIKDLTIPSVTFYEHIQLTIFLENLITLLEHIRALDYFLKKWK